MKEFINNIHEGSAAILTNEELEICAQAADKWPKGTPSYYYYYNVNDGMDEDFDVESSDVIDNGNYG